MTTCVCRRVLAVEDEVKDFLAKVRGTKEESVTDFLHWRLELIGQPFKFTSFNRRQERLNGADFGLEIWILGKSKAVGLRVQAKKLLVGRSQARKSLAYTPKGAGKRQVETLIASADATNPKQIPIFAIYTDWVPRCCSSDPASHSVSPVRLINARFIDSLVSKTTGGLSLDTVLADSMPFNHLVCTGSMSADDHLSEVARQLGSVDLTTRRDAEVWIQKRPSREGARFWTGVEGLPQLLAVIDLDQARLP
jgi:hypothetical protein